MTQAHRDVCRPWTPVVDDVVLEDRVRSVVRDILEDLDGHPVEDISLASGRVGVALGFDYIGRAVPELPSRDIKAVGQQIVSDLGSATLDASLYGGFTGVAWGLGTILNLDEASFIEVDSTLSELIDSGRLLDDLVYGLAGFGLYAMSRLPSSGGENILGRVVEVISDRAIHDDAGLTWYTRPENLPTSVTSEYPSGYMNVGVAHGVPGQLYVLAAAAAAGVPVDRHVLDRGLAWLMSKADFQAEGSVLPTLVLPDGFQVRPARTAWCYGDLGVSVVLVEIARLLGRRDLFEFGSRLGLAAAARPADESKVVDAGLCHGAAGIAHAFGRLFQRTGDPRFQDAALFWVRRTLDMRTRGQGIGGYRAWAFDAWTDRTGLLTGASGIAAALAAAISPVDPGWDEFLLCSTRATIEVRAED